MTRVPLTVEPVQATVVPAPDEAYVAQLEFDNAVLAQKLQRGELELARLRWQCDQLRQALDRASGGSGGRGDTAAGDDAALALAELHRQRDGLLERLAAAERERDLLRLHALDLE